MITIFIRTYHNDIKWLNYCLQSIHKNLVGWDEIVICIPIGQESLLNHLTAEKVVIAKMYKDDYLGQQISKIKAAEHCMGEYILFIDSDVIFYKGADVRDYFQDNKPVILKQKYTEVQEAICWKAPTERLFGEAVEYEYMRRAPQLFHKSTLLSFNKRFPDIENYVISQPFREFSEFNALGFFAEKMHQEEYTILDLAHNPIPKNLCKQFWSWSNLTEEDLRNISEILQ